MRRAEEDKGGDRGKEQELMASKGSSRGAEPRELGDVVVLVMIWTPSWTFQPGRKKQLALAQSICYA